MNYPAAEQRGIPRTLNAPRGGELNPERLKEIVPVTEWKDKFFDAIWMAPFCFSLTADLTIYQG